MPDINASTLRPVFKRLLHPLTVSALWVLLCVYISILMESWLPLLLVPIGLLVGPGFQVILGGEGWKIAPNLARLGVVAMVLYRVIWFWLDWGVGIGGSDTLLLAFVCLAPGALIGLVATIGYGATQAGRIRWRAAYPLLIYLIAVALWIASFSNAFPMRGTKEQALNNFWRHQDQLSQLATMAREDRWQQITEDMEEQMGAWYSDWLSPKEYHWTSDKPPIDTPSERWREYKRLIQEAGLTEGLVVRPNRVYFIYGDLGGLTYAYVYEPGSRARSLAESQYWTPITDNWYLFANSYDSNPRLWPRAH